MSVFKVTTRIKDEDSGESRSWTDTVAASSVDVARLMAKRDAEQLRDVYPDAKISVSVKLVDS